MKAFPSYAANPEKQQFSFRSRKSAILPSVIGNFDDPVPIGYLGLQDIQKKSKLWAVIQI